MITGTQSAGTANDGDTDQQWKPLRPMTCQPTRVSTNWVRQRLLANFKPLMGTLTGQPTNDGDPGEQPSLGPLQ